MSEKIRKALIEDALARVLSRAYIAAAQQDDEYEEGTANTDQVEEDEALLRGEIFSNDRSTK